MILLKISFNDHFGVGEKLEDLPSMALDIPKHGIPGTAKGEKLMGAAMPILTPIMPGLAPIRIFLTAAAFWV